MPIGDLPPIEGQGSAGVPASSSEAVPTEDAPPMTDRKNFFALDFRELDRGLTPEPRRPVGSRRYAVIAGKYGGSVFCNLPDGPLCQSVEVSPRQHLHCSMRLPPSPCFSS